MAPGTGLPVVGDVGWFDAEEIDVAPAGANLGWPCFEGLERTMQYESTARCAALYRSDADVAAPVIDLPHPDARAVTGGVFYTGDAYPHDYLGRYFYADWSRGWIRHARIDAVNGELEGEPVEFAESAGGPVDLQVGPDGLLYVLSLNNGELLKITYSD